MEKQNNKQNSSTNKSPPPLLPRVQNENRRSPRNHQSSQQLEPTRASYNIPIPKSSLPPAHETNIKKSADDIIFNVIEKFNNQKDPPANHALNEALFPTSHSAYLAFLYPSLNHIYNEKGKKQTIQDLLKSNESSKWTRALSNEFGRLANGNIHGIKGTNTIEFIKKSDVPSNKKVTYATFVCDHKPLKEEKWRVRCVAGGDKLPYPGDASSPAASMIDTKLIINSTISDAHKNARFLSADLKDFFLGTLMHTAEYMKLSYEIFPEDIRQKYNLDQLVHEDGYVYIKIKKGMYGLKQAAILAYKQLKKHLEPYGYEPVPTSLSLWHHRSKKTKFCLCVDDFGIKYFSKADADHLIHALRQKYPTSVDWEGKNYCGYELN